MRKQGRFTKPMCRQITWSLGRGAPLTLWSRGYERNTKEKCSWGGLEARTALTTMTATTEMPKKNERAKREEGKNEESEGLESKPLWDNNNNNKTATTIKLLARLRRRPLLMACTLNNNNNSARFRCSPLPLPTRVLPLPPLNHLSLVMRLLRIKAPQRLPNWIKRAFCRCITLPSRPPITG